MAAIYATEADWHVSNLRAALDDFVNYQLENWKVCKNHKLAPCAPNDYAAGLLLDNLVIAWQRLDAYRQELLNQLEQEAQQ